MTTRSPSVPIAARSQYNIGRTALCNARKRIRRRHYGADRIAAGGIHAMCVVVVVPYTVGRRRTTIAIRDGRRSGLERTAGAFRANVRNGSFVSYNVCIVRRRDTVIGIYYTRRYIVYALKRRSRRGNDASRVCMYYDDVVVMPT